MRIFWVQVSQNHMSKPVNDLPCYLTGHTSKANLT